MYVKWLFEENGYACANLSNQFDIKYICIVECENVCNVVQTYVQDFGSNKRQVWDRP